MSCSLKTLLHKRLVLLLALLSIPALLTNNASAKRLITFPCGYVENSEEYFVDQNKLAEILFLTSPDGAWRVFGATSFGDDWQRDIYSLSVINSEREMTHTVTFSKTFGVKYGALDGIIDVLHWTNDSKYVYLTVTPQGDGPSVYLRDGALLLRMDTETGNVKTIVETAVDTEYGRFADDYAFSITPNDNLLLSIRHSRPPQFTITDLKTGRQSKMKLRLASAYAAGNIIWAPDGSHVAFLALENFDDVVGWSLNIHTGQARRLWAGSRKLLSTYLVGWSDSRHVTVATGPEDRRKAIACEQIDVRTGKSAPLQSNRTQNILIAQLNEAIYVHKG